MSSSGRLPAAVDCGTDPVSLYPASVPVMIGKWCTGPPLSLRASIDYSDLLNPVYLRDSGPRKYTVFSFPGLGGTGDGLCPDGKDRVGSCWTRKVVCSVDSSHTFYVKSGSSCGRPACRHHWKIWANREAQRLRAHVCGYQTAADYPYPARHVVFSLNPAEASEFLRKYGHDEVLLYTKLNAHFLKQAKKSGIIGGSKSLHAYRVKRTIKDKFAGQGNIWDIVRGAVNDGADLLDYVYWSPHAHFICYGKMAPIKGAGKDRTVADFDYTMIRALNTEDEVEKAAYYILSHCALNPKPGCFNVTYFGVCSSKYLKLEWQQYFSEDDTCCDCGAVRVYDDPSFVPGGGRPDTREVATRRRLYAEYSVTGPKGPPDPDPGCVLKT
ncbi:hypothetical protein ES708_17285 [subsurface metagenome]